MYISLLGGVLGGSRCGGCQSQGQSTNALCFFYPYPRLGALIQAYSVFLHHICIYSYTMCIYDQLTY